MAHHTHTKPQSPPFSPSPFERTSTLSRVSGLALSPSAPQMYSKRARMASKDRGVKRYFEQREARGSMMRDT